MDIFLPLLESFLPLLFFLFPLLIPVLVVLRIFRFKDVLVKIIEEARKNPQFYKDNPEAARALMRQLQKSKGGASSQPGQKSAGSSQGQAGKRSSLGSVPSSSRSAGMLHSGRDLRSKTPARRSSPIRGTARMTQLRQEQKIKTSVAVLFLVGGVSLLFSNYAYGYNYETFYGGIVLMAAGLYLLKTDIERV